MQTRKFSLSIYTSWPAHPGKTQKASTSINGFNDGLE
jgi:hypothetical protein